MGLRELLQEHRARLGMTQKQLAELAGVNQPTISDIERGQVKLPNADIRRRLAKALGVSHLDLLVAAGEITEAEPIRPDDPRAELIALVKRVRWTDERVALMRLQLNGMIDFDGRGKRG